MKELKIQSIKSRQILDSRSNPTVEVEIKTEKGTFFSSVPSGASRGKHEAIELRDGKKDFFGKSVKKAVNNVEEVIAQKVIKEKFKDQKEFDQRLIEIDGTSNKSKLGANAILAVSMAAARAWAASENVPLYQYILETGKQIFGVPIKEPKMPKACFNILNGGAHAGNDLDIQEFMIVPQKDSFSENLQIASEIYHTLKNILENKFGKNAVNVGDEGGFAPPLSKTEEALSLISEAIEKSGYKDYLKIGIDAAASQFFKDGKYLLEAKEMDREELLNFYKKIVNDFPILFIEDPFSEEDWQGFELIEREIGGKEGIFIVGDDLLCTNPSRIKEAQDRKACNAMILKPNQIGTVSQAIEAGKLAKDFGWKIIVSHRSGDTCDSFISDFAVGINSQFIKSGAPARGERIAKYNQLLRIEERLKK